MIPSQSLTEMSKSKSLKVDILRVGHAGIVLSWCLPRIEKGRWRAERES